MSIEEDLYSLVQSDTTVTGYVGPRFFPGIAPQDADFPYMEYHRLTTTRLRHLGGRSRLAHPRFQLNIWSTGYDQCKAIADAVGDLVGNYTGTPAAIDVRRIYLNEEADDLEPAVGLESRRLYGRRLDITVWHADT